MQPEFQSTTFDWKGFKFATLCAVLLCFAFGAAQLYTQAEISKVEQDVVVAAIVGPRVPVSLKPQKVVFDGPTTSLRVIRSLAIADTVPQSGKFIAADLETMHLFLYENGSVVQTFEILSKGKSGTPWETPAGFYDILTKEKSHFSSLGRVHMPYSMQFLGNYFIHGWPYYPDGTPVASAFSGGCIRLSTDNAKKVFEFADVGTHLFVFDKSSTESFNTLFLAGATMPHIAADSFVVADIDTGDVYLEKNAGVRHPIASITKLMTALVANETISYNKTLGIEARTIIRPRSAANLRVENFTVSALLYPLLLQSNNQIASALASKNGTEQFVAHMNKNAEAFNMNHTAYADASGLSPENISTPDDLFKLLRYLAHKKSFVLDITRLKNKNITAQSGRSYHLTNVNQPIDSEPFIGGKVGFTDEAAETMAALTSFPIAGKDRRVAIIILKSSDQEKDLLTLAQWIKSSAEQGELLAQTACTTCSTPTYRKIPE